MPEVPTAPSAPQVVVHRALGDFGWWAPRDTSDRRPQRAKGLAEASVAGPSVALV